MSKTKRQTYKDDGKFFIVGNVNSPERNGFLIKRGGEYSKSMGGYELQSLGEQKGKYRVDINKHWDGESDCLMLGHCDTLQEAIDLLWAKRHEATN